MLDDLRPDAFVCVNDRSAGTHAGTAGVGA
jgi:hypothetical protein